MIKKFEATLPELQKQFEDYLAPLLPEIQEVALYAQEAHADDNQLSEHSDRLGTFLARVNGIYGEMEGFLTQFKAVATEAVIAERGPEFGASLIGKLVGKHTAQVEQAYKTVDRLSATITHQLTNINARIWKAREEMKMGGQNNQPRR